MADEVFITDYLRKIVVSDVVEVAHFHAANTDSDYCGGCLSVPREVFCIVDFLGAVAYNNNPSRNEDGASTRKAVRFIREFFPIEYSEFAELIVAMWRHGTVHALEPRKYTCRANGRRIEVRWTSNNGPEQHNRDANVRWYTVADDPGTYSIAVNICALADDLLVALDRLVVRMQQDSGFGRACVRRLNRVLRSEDCHRIPRVGKTVQRVLAGQVAAVPAASRGILFGDQVRTEGPPNQRIQQTREALDSAAGDGRAADEQTRQQDDRTPMP